MDLSESESPIEGSQPQSNPSTDYEILFKKHYKRTKQNKYKQTAVFLIYWADSDMKAIEKEASECS